MKILGKYPSSRLFCLDCLRGLDMLLLTVITPIVGGANASWKLPDGVMAHFRHVWGVTTLHDLIMPCFIFMCGAAIPFSLAKRLKDGKPTRDFWTHVLKRFLMLYILGSIVQCNLLSLDPMKIHVFYNTLQVIGVAYVTAAFVLLIPSRVVQMLVPVALAAAMGLIVHLCGHGDYTKEGNFTYVFDRMVWGAIFPAGQHSLKPNGYFTYLLPQLGCSAITLCGYECAMVLNGAKSQWRKAMTLFGLAAALFAAGWLVSFKVPVIKHIYTLPFCLYTTAWSVLALATLYVLTDIWKLRRGTALLILFGQNALAAYMVRSVVGGSGALNSFAKYFTKGLPQYFGDSVLPFANAVVSALALVALVGLWHVYKAYRKLPDAQGA